ncbi:hypothetical protein [Rhodopseudomonas palustris]|uniref:Uncharacterized protein n=1 Tax=Rhodopseudomonas palustris TaxID=1076 RepID=A0A418VD78_RHOPL|nr:hypothetical protein [Rhodopseudomonas palustris]RJF74100.1 hypothetical protein D4Q52_13115 [Rhodopseudomonas palustris]
MDSRLLATLHGMRTSPAYQSAEALRRRLKAGGKSSAAAATDSEASEALGAILLLIGTWETIAVLLQGAGDASEYFALAPVSYMWGELAPAIYILRSSDPQCARHFERLGKEHADWISKMKEQGEYQTGDCHGCLHAMFG